MAAETEVLFIRGEKRDTDATPLVDGQLIVEIASSYDKGNLTTDVTHNGNVRRIKIAGSEGEPTSVSASEVTYDNTTSGLTADNVQDAIDDLVQKDYSFVQYTILASGWDTNNIYSFETLYPSTTYDILNIVPNDNTTSEMRTAWANAQCGGYKATNVIEAHGTVPTVDIIVELLLMHK